MSDHKHKKICQAGGLETCQPRDSMKTWLTFEFPVVYTSVPSILSHRASTHLRLHRVCHVHIGFLWVWNHQAIDIVPGLRPHVSCQGEKERVRKREREREGERERERGRV